MDSLRHRMREINPLSSEWCLEYKPLNHAQLISMLERATILSRLEVVKCILAILVGNDSELFVWREKKFQISQGYSTAHLNLSSFRSLLMPYAILGTQVRQMQEFTELEFFRGQTFSAFQNILRNMLEELTQHITQVLDYFVNNKSKTVNEFTISLLALGPFLDSDKNHNILLTIRNLHSIYLDVVHELPVNRERLYMNQTLTAIYKRLFIPHKRIRSLVYTMFDYCLRPMFIHLEYLLTQFESISELSESEFPFSSEFKDDQEMYYKSYSHENLDLFWEHFFHFDEKSCKEMPLLSSDSLKTIAEAIKSSFVLRKNGIEMKSLSNGACKFLATFHANLNTCLKRYSDGEESYDIDTQFEEQIITLEVADPIKQYLKLPTLRTRHFKSYSLPLRTVCDVHIILEESLRSTFEAISRPIIQEFLSEFRSRHLKLLRYYNNFFLVQHPEHILQYMYSLFPLMNEIIATKNFNMIEKLLNQLHLNNTTDFAKVMQFFRPHLDQFEPLKSINDHTIHLELFNSLYFLPSFDNDFKQSTGLECKKSRPFYDFWPLTQLFNSEITGIFNQFFNSLLKLRYIQYKIGVDFFLSGKFRDNNLSRQNYIFRFRLLNPVVLTCRDLEYNLRKLVQRTEQRFDQAANFDSYLSVHKQFLYDLSHMNNSISKNHFILNILSSALKFCHTNGSQSPKKKNNRTRSAYNALVPLDRIKSSDFLGTLQV